LRKISSSGSFRNTFVKIIKVLSAYYASEKKIFFNIKNREIIGSRIVTSLAAITAIEKPLVSVCSKNTSISTFRQFHQHFTYEFFVRTSFYYVHVTRKKAAKMTFVRKIHA